MEEAEEAEKLAQQEEAEAAEAAEVVANQSQVYVHTLEFLVHVNRKSAFGKPQVTEFGNSFAALVHHSTDEVFVKTLFHKEPNTIRVLCDVWGGEEEDLAAKAENLADGQLGTHQISAYVGMTIQIREQADMPVVKKPPKRNLKKMLKKGVQMVTLGVRLQSMTKVAADDLMVRLGQSKSRVEDDIRELNRKQTRRIAERVAGQHKKSLLAAEPKAMTCMTPISTLPILCTLVDMSSTLLLRMLICQQLPTRLPRSVRTRIVPIAPPRYASLLAVPEVSVLLCAGCCAGISQRARR